MGLMALPGTEREIVVAPPEMEEPIELPSVPIEQPPTPVDDPAGLPS
jgi:hypothetical protein